MVLVAAGTQYQNTAARSKRMWNPFMTLTESYCYLDEVEVYQISHAVPTNMYIYCECKRHIPRHRATLSFV